MSNTSCFIDGKGVAPIDFFLSVIDYALSRGFELDEPRYRQDIEWLKTNEDDEERLLDIEQALNWTMDDAVDHLNEIDHPVGRAWFVDDQCLFREEGID